MTCFAIKMFPASFMQSNFFLSLLLCMNWQTFNTVFHSIKDLLYSSIVPDSMEKPVMFSIVTCYSKFRCLYYLSNINNININTHVYNVKQGPNNFHCVVSEEIVIESGWRLLWFVVNVPQAHMLKSWSPACGTLGRWQTFKRWSLVGAS
jgi:hypothetical protein